jgi:hypothetical protein
MEDSSSEEEFQDSDTESDEDKVSQPKEVKTQDYPNYGSVVRNDFHTDRESLSPPSSDLTSTLTTTRYLHHVEEKECIIDEGKTFSLSLS